MRAGRLRARPIGIGALVLGGLALATALAFFVAPQASDEPDGLERVAIDEGFADQETGHALEDAPTAGYGVEGVDDERLSTGLAGTLGVAITFGLAMGVFALVRRRDRGRAAGDGGPGDAGEPGGEPGPGGEGPAAG